MEGPRIEEFYLGESDLEAYYTEYPYSAMAIQPSLSNATKRARELEAHGYHRKPPRDGRRACFALQSLNELDEVSIAATTRALPDHVSSEEIVTVREAYRASEYGDAYWIAFYAEIHLHVVIAVLRWLSARGELPES